MKVKMIRRIENIHKAGHSERYLLNNHIPVIDFRFAVKENMLIATDDDGGVNMYVIKL